jgi:uncharacterized protein
MSGRKGRVAHCFRCVYTWKSRRERAPRMCPRCKSRRFDEPKLRPITLGHGLGIPEIVAPHRQAILRAAHRYGVRRLWIFGSVRRREATRRSDVDILVEWGRPVSLLELADFRVELRKALGRNVDVVNRHGLHWAIEPRVEAEKVPL